MTIVGIRETEQVIGWAIMRVNKSSEVKHVYDIRPVPNRPFVAVSASPDALEALYISLSQAGCEEFKVGELRMHEVSAAGF